MRRGAAGSLLVQIGGAGLGFILHIFLARLMGLTEYGIYAFALTWVNVLCMFASLGQAKGAARLVPTYILQMNWDELRGFRRGASTIALAASLVILLVGVLVVYLLRGFLSPSLELTFLASFLLLPILTQLQLNGALFRGLKRPISFGAYSSLLRPLVFIGLIWLLYLLRDKPLDAPVAMLAGCVAALVGVICSEYMLTRVWPPASRRARPRYATGIWLRLGSRLIFMGAIGIVLNQVDVLLLGGLAGTEAVGPYSVAMRLAALAIYGITAVNVILAPMIAELHAAHDHAELARLVRHSVKLGFAATIVAAVIIAVAGPWILTLFGSGFTVAYVPLLVLLGGQCVSAAVGPVALLMTMTRFEGQAALFLGAGALVNVLLCVLLVPRLGVLGAAIASASAAVAWKASALPFIIRKLGINPTILSLRAA